MASIINRHLICLFANVKYKFPKQNSFCYSKKTSRKLFSTNINQKESSDEQQQQKDQQPQSECNTKILKIAVIGVPNAGKSTFINNLINHRVCPISNKVHTTRNANKAIYTTNNTQLILFDTPGLVTNNEIKKHNLQSSFNSAYKHSIQHGNIICVIHDVSNTWQRHQLHSTVLDTLNLYPKLPSFLVLNKIDCLKSKRILLDLVKNLTNNTLVANKRKSKNKKDSEKAKNDVKTTENEEEYKKLVGWSNFSDVFMVSSITGDGLQDVLQFLLKKSQLGNWEYSEDVYTDQKPEDLIVESVRARLLDYLPQEIPYTLKSQIEYYNINKGVIYASVQVTCPNARIEKLVCGEMNGKLKQITERVTSDLVETFGKAISLTITTCTVKKSNEIKN